MKFSDLLCIVCFSCYFILRIFFFSKRICIIPKQPPRSEQQTQRQNLRISPPFRNQLKFKTPLAAKSPKPDRFFKKRRLRVQVRFQKQCRGVQKPCPGVQKPRRGFRNRAWGFRNHACGFSTSKTKPPQALTPPPQHPKTGIPNPSWAIKKITLESRPFTLESRRFTLESRSFTLESRRRRRDSRVKTEEFKA